MSFKRIAVDARMIRNSGIGTVLANILKRWISLGQGTEFYLLGDPELLGGYPWACVEQVEIIPCRAPIYSVEEQFALPRAIPAEADLLWVPHYNIPLFYRGKLLVMVHDVFHLDMAHLVPGVHRRLYAKLMFKAVAAKADKIICVSHFTEDRLRYFEPQLPNRKTCVIYNGIDSFWQRLEAKKNSNRRPYILFVGNVKPHKNLARLIGAYARVCAEIPHDLIIVGKKDGFVIGDENAKLRAASLGERVRFTGQVSNEELRELYGWADLFVFPTLYEGFGLPPLEAIASGCRRLLLSDIPVLHEIYGEAAYYVSPLDESAIGACLVSALASEPISDREAARLLEKFSWEKAAVSVKAVAESLIT